MTRILTDEELDELRWNYFWTHHVDFDEIPTDILVEACINQDH